MNQTKSRTEAIRAAIAKVLALHVSFGSTSIGATDWSAA